MRIKIKILKRIVSLILSVLLFINPLVVPIAYAEGEEGVTPTPTEEIVTPLPTDPSPSPVEQPPEQQGDPMSSTAPATPTEAPQSTIDTGDANSSSSVETTVNTNIDCVDGSLNTPTDSCTPPEGQTTCPGDIGIGNSNQATVSGTTDSSANTGSNEEGGSAGDATINTGDATASGQIQNEVNTNIVELSPGATAPTVSSGDTSPFPTGQNTLSVENQNQAQTENNAQVTAETGENIALDNLGDIKINTGDATAWVNVLNFLNTNIVGSNFELLILDLVGEEDQTINLNELWRRLMESQANGELVLAEGTDLSHLTISIFNSNDACLSNKIDVLAESGGNEGSGNQSAGIETGDTKALANVTNVVNTNILGAKFFFGIINILGDSKGNLIFPRLEIFFLPGIGGTGPEGTVNFQNANEATINNEISTLADSGTNSTSGNGGDSSVETGAATAITNSYTLANLNLWRNYWYWLLFNNLGGWQGKILNWSSPGAIEEPTLGSQELSAGPADSAGVGGTGGVTPTPGVNFQNQNQAWIGNEINVWSSSGRNRANFNLGGASIKTGNAWAAANLFNLVNLNLLGGNWFFNIVNILGNWQGNVIFAYPDLVVDLGQSNNQVEVGQTTVLTVNYANEGYDETDEAWVSLNLPKGVSYVSDTSGKPSEISGQDCRWGMGSLMPGQNGSFMVTVRINPDFDFSEKTSFLGKFIPKAYAAENRREKEIIAEASIGANEEESNMNNNSSSVVTLVYEPAGSDSGVDQRQPILEITAKNNVNQFVYPGDTVSFVVTIENKSDVPVYEAVFRQRLFNGGTHDFGFFNFMLGTIEPGKKGTLTFGIKLLNAKPIETGDYWTIAQVEGKALNGNEAFSNEARTDFKVKLREVASLFEAKAAGKEEEILGVESKCPEEKEKILPYILLLVLSSWWIVDRNRRFSQRFFLKKNEKK